MWRARILIRSIPLILAAVGFLTLPPVARGAALTDMLGRPVPVPEGPLRIVSLAPSLTEIVFALGRGDWLQAVTDFCDYPPPARVKPRVGGPTTPDLERIVQMRPDLVLATTEGNPRDVVARLDQVSIPVFVVKPDGYAGVLASIRVLGDVLGAGREAADVVRSLEARAAAVRRKVRGRPRVRTLLLVWADPLIAVAPTTVVGDLLEMAGGENIIRERAVQYPRLGWEEVVGRAPEVILVADHRESDRAPREEALSNAPWNRWPNIPAVRAGRVVLLPADPLLRPGPRVADGLERVARAIHPEAFAQVAPR
jgi:iron complex transport system substrate-binding protein